MPEAVVNGDEIFPPVPRNGWNVGSKELASSDRRVEEIARRRGSKGKAGRWGQEARRARERAAGYIPNAPGIVYVNSFGIKRKERWTLAGLTTGAVRVMTNTFIYALT